MSATLTVPVAQNAALNVQGMLAKLQQNEITKAEFLAFLKGRTPDTLTVLTLVGSGVLTAQEANEFVHGQKKQPLYAKVSEKGGISVYGLQRMPVTLYGEQWDRLIAYIPQLQAFKNANQAKLSTKAAKA
jgi:hypothetical protein